MIIKKSTDENQITGITMYYGIERRNDSLYMKCYDQYLSCTKWYHDKPIIFGNFETYLFETCKEFKFEENCRYKIIDLE